MAIRKWEAVVLALHDAGGLTKPIDTEDVAMAVQRISPGAFSWRKYPEQIDLDSVRVSLTDACKPKHGALVVGSVGTGWHLSDAGASWLQGRGLEARVELGVAGPEKRLDARLESAHVGREAARIRASAAYGQWIEGESLTSRDAAAVFRIDRYTSARDRTLKTRRVVVAIEVLEDEKLSEFLAVAATKAEELEDLEPIVKLAKTENVEKAQ